MFQHCSLVLGDGEWLSDSEKLRLSGILKIKRRREYLASRFLVRCLISSAFYNSQKFWENFVIDSFPEKPPTFEFFLLNKKRINISLSHSNGYILCGLAGDAIGVDVEVETLKIRSYDAIYELISTDYQRNEYIEKPSKEKKKIFFKEWTAKESFVKRLGLGIDFDLLRNINSKKSDNSKNKSFCVNFNCKNVTGLDVFVAICLSKKEDILFIGDEEFYVYPDYLGAEYIFD